MNISLYDAACAIGGELIGGECEIEHITTDSRDVRTNGLFVALCGERFDGNDFAADYLNSGGRAVVISRDMEIPEGKSAIKVSDTKSALLLLAKHYREKFSVKMIGITGSVGKTSTKEMVASVLNQGFCVLKTDKNFNNEIGVPLTLFGLKKTHTAAVCEMGMNAPCEISRISYAVKPDIAIITNIGTAHIGNLGSQENILKAKLEVVENISPDGILILNGDDKLLWSIKDKINIKKLYYGIENKQADIIAKNVVLNLENSTFEYKGTAFNVPIAGVHHVYNALSAIAVGLFLEMEISDVAKGVKSYTLPGMRQKTEEINGITIIEDCYNSSPDSCDAALKVLANYKKRGRTIAVLGDILEQGEFSDKLHREVGRKAAENNIDILVTVGELSHYMADEAKKFGLSCVKSFTTTYDAAKYLNSISQKKDTVLFKASRGMKLEEAVELFKAGIRIC